MGFGGPTKHPSASANHYYNEALGASVTEVFAFDGNLFGFEFENNSDTDAVYIQFFDAASAGAVTLGTTAPDFTIKLPAGGVWGKDSKAISLHYFAKGCYVAATAGRTDAVAPAAAPTVHFWHSNK